MRVLGVILFAVLLLAVVLSGEASGDGCPSGWVNNEAGHCEVAPVTADEDIGPFTDGQVTDAGALCVAVSEELVECRFVYGEDGHRVHPITRERLKR